MTFESYCGRCEDLIFDFESFSFFRCQYRRIQDKDITDDRLPVMCIALWKKMKYAIKKDQKQDLS